MPVPSPELPAWFADRVVRLLAEPEFVHTDSCSWMGFGAEHPCTCRVPELLRVVAERVGPRPTLDIERACDYLGRVAPEQPEPPDATVLTGPPKDGTARQWLTTWRPVRIRLRGSWRIGIVKAQVQLEDGGWVLLVEHASDGMHSEWPAATWVLHQAGSVQPLDAEPPA